MKLPTLKSLTRPALLALSLCTIFASSPSFAASGNLTPVDLSVSNNENFTCPVERERGCTKAKLQEILRKAEQQLDYLCIDLSGKFGGMSRDNVRHEIKVNGLEVRRPGDAPATINIQVESKVVCQGI